MLLALRRWLGMSTPVVHEADGVIDRKAQKWVIEPARVGLVARVEELWRYRRILWFFASRRIKEKQGARLVDMMIGRFVGGDATRMVWLLMREDWVGRQAA